MPDEADALRWAQENLAEFRAKVREIFRSYMERERKLKKTGGKWIDSWRWEHAVAEILDVAPDSRVVLDIGDKLRKLEATYRLENYDDSDRFERLLDRLQDLIRSI